MNIIKDIQKLNKILSKHQKKRIIELFLLMIIGAFLETLSISMILPFMDIVTNPSASLEKGYNKFIFELFHFSSIENYLVILSIALALVFILKNAFLFFEYCIQYHFVYKNMYLMQQRLLKNILGRPYESFLSISSGDVVRLINVDVSHTFALLKYLLNLFTELIVSLMLVISLFIYTPYVTLIVCLVLLMLVMLINKKLKPIMTEQGVRYQQAMAGMNKWLLQAIQGIKEIKVFSREKFFVKQFDHYGNEGVITRRKSETMTILPRLIIESLCMGTMFVAIAIMIINGTSMESIIPMLSVVALAAIRLLPSVNRITSNLTSISYSEPMLDSLIGNLNEFSELEMSSESKGYTEETNNNRGKNGIQEIRIQDLSYHYPGTERDILKNASLVIKKGESIGIVGGSGAGKTTTVDLILGLLTPTKGEILANGYSIANDLRGWHNQIGYIPQNIFLMDDTIRSNVAFGYTEEQIQEDLVWDALEQAALSEFVHTLPDGLDTEIGERGIRLSGGQRQRIGIARALYSNPEILILDEATSSLDTETEASIIESVNLLQGNKTIIIIAHRLSTIEKCDHIYRVENGKIIQER